MLLSHSQICLFLQGVSGIGLNRILDVWQLMQSGDVSKGQQRKCEIDTHALIFTL